jgi:hypothetical protein
VHGATKSGVADISQCSLIRMPPEFMDAEQPLLRQVHLRVAFGFDAIVTISSSSFSAILITHSHHAPQVHTIIMRSNLLTFLPKSMLCLSQLHTLDLSHNNLPELHNWIIDLPCEPLQ